MNRTLQGAKEALAIAQGSSMGERITPAEEPLDISTAIIFKGAHSWEDMTK